MAALWAASAAAHEVLPAIADMERQGNELVFTVEAPLEGFVAGIDLGAVDDTNAAPEAETYDALRALPPAEMDARFRDFWPDMAERIEIRVDGAPAAPELRAVAVPEVTDTELPRPATFTFAAPLPEGAETVQVGWDEAFGTLVLRQQGVEAPYDGYLEAGATSDPIRLAGGDQAGPWQVFVDYIPVGFEHILPLGLDHILFVLGLFFLSDRLRPLLWQVSAFTLAHTVTLALAALGYVSVPASIVEPLIAASIAFVALENIFFPRLGVWRPAIVFGFGLLHGLGFASVLGEFGLPAGAFVPALIGFNIGVELGQLAVIAMAFIVVGLAWKRDWYRQVIAIPASAAIALIGAYWVVERTML
ncbi:HupE / UreJ protein [Limimaricola pyoseonensis]|uniref:HupE / UreJ protein n=2 Tax=Limimaricola pyoseonensis TaxID=521013 RepID=A0A1G7AAD0_9RHOB|nr:HupE / UreJ protein [Limimaricola pyoseonensis]